MKTLTEEQEKKMFENEAIIKCLNENPSLTAYDVSKKLNVSLYRGRVLLNEALNVQLSKHIKQINKKTKSKKISNGEFGNTEGLYKDVARTKIIESIRNKYSVMLTLPFEKAILEKRMLKEVFHKLNFIGYEWEQKTFWNLCKLIGEEQLPITPIHGSISNGIYGAKKDQYSNLILDYCGVLDTFAEEIKFAIENDIVESDGIIAVTLSKMGICNNTGIIGNIFKTTPYEMFDTKMSETELGIKLFFNKILKSNYTMELVFNYRDKKDNGNLGMPMILVIVRRNS